MKCEDFCRSHRHCLKAAMEQSQIFWKERWKRDDSEGCDDQETAVSPPHSHMHLTEDLWEALVEGISHVITVTS